MIAQRSKALFLVFAEPRPGCCSTATKEPALRPRSSNVFFHRRRFRQQCDAKSKSTFRKGSAAFMGMAHQRHGRLAINLIPAAAISNSGKAIRPAYFDFKPTQYPKNGLVYPRRDTLNCEINVQKTI